LCGGGVIGYWVVLCWVIGWWVAYCWLIGRWVVCSLVFGWWVCVIELLVDGFLAPRVDKSGCFPTQRDVIAYCYSRWVYLGIFYW
jgi:hypothetical protein